MTASTWNEKISIVFIILFACVSWGGQYYFRGLWEPDEARYTYVAKEMRQTSHLLVPHRNGEFYAHKPPLMFWMINAATFVTKGEFNGVSGRLPTLFGVILSLWAITRFGRLWYDRETAWRALFICSTSFLFWHKAGTGQIDMLLLGFELSAAYLLFENDEKPSPWKRATAFSLMGLAILAKGPVGLIVPIGIYVTGNLFSGQLMKTLHRYFLWGVPFALLWPIAWLLCAKWIGDAPDAYFNELLFDQNLGRFQGTFGGHNKPFYYYLKYLVIDFLPWTFFIPATVVLLKNRPGLSKQSLTLVGWIVFVVFFFSLCGGKRNLYILSVYPAAALLTASILPSMKDIPRKWQNTMVYPLLMLLLVLSVASLFTPHFLPFSVSVMVFIPGSILTFTGSVWLWYLFRKQGLTSNWFTIFILMISLLFFSTGTFVFQAFDPVKTPVALADAVRKNLPENQKILYYRMNGELQSLYSDRLGLRFSDLDKLVETMQRNSPGFVVTSKKCWDELQPIVGSWGEPHEFGIGDKSLVWLEYAIPENNAGEYLGCES